MAEKKQRDYGRELERVKQALRDGIPLSWDRLGKHLDLPITTLRQIVRSSGFTNLREFADDLLGNDAVQKLGVTIEKQANSLHVVDVSPFAKTADELIKSNKIDMKEWQLVKQEPRNWQVVTKLRDAKKTIVKDTQKEKVVHLQDIVVRVPIFYLSTNFIRRNPQPISPTIQPVSIEIPKYRPTTSKTAVKRALILADPQIGFRRRLHTGELLPFHDRRVLDIIWQVLQHEHFDYVGYIGDVNDWSEWSKYRQEPEFYWTTQPALIETAWWLAKYRQSQPHAKMDLFKGNHEIRVEDVVVDHLKAAYELRPVDQLEFPPSLSVPRLLALHDLNINYVDNYPGGGMWLNKNIWIEHGYVVAGATGDTAKAVAMKRTHTTIMGHIHRRESVARKIETREGSEIHTSMCPGCACHIDGRTPGSKPSDQWQQGFAVVEYTDTFENIVTVAVENGQAIYKGEMLLGQSRDDEINQMLLKKLQTIPMKKFGAS